MSDWDIFQGMAREVEMKLKLWKEKQKHFLYDKGGKNKMTAKIEGLLERIDGVNKALGKSPDYQSSVWRGKALELSHHKLNLLESIVRLIYERGGEK